MVRVLRKVGCLNASISTVLNRRETVGGIGAGLGLRAIQLFHCSQRLSVLALKKGACAVNQMSA